MARAGESTAGAVQVSISPELSVRRGRAAVEFYKTAFGAREIYRVGGTDENQAVVAQLSVGHASFWVSDESPPNKNFSPESLGGSTVRLLLIVEDPRAAIKRAVASGATEVFPVAEEHGWLLGRIADPFGLTGRSASRWSAGRRRAHVATPEGVAVIDRRRGSAVPAFSFHFAAAFRLG